MNKELLTKDTSLQLALLKLLACVGVVYIHGYMLHFNFFTINSESMPVVYYVQTILSQYISRVAVPVFFAVSGYIYAAKQYQDNSWQFCCRKAKGVLWPYLLWNSIAIFYIFLAQILPGTRKYFTEYLIISNFTAHRWLESYVGWGNSWFPFLYPLWFLPYLFAAFMIVHLLRKWLNKAPWMVWVLAVLNIVCSAYIPLNKYLANWGPSLRLLYAVSFFSAGMLLVQYHTRIAGKKVLLASGGIFVAVTVISFMKVTAAVNWTPLTWYAGLIFIFSVTSHVGKCGEKLRNTIAFLSGFSFLIYVTHEYMMTVITKLVYPALPAETWCILLTYLFIPVVLISVLITGGWVLKKLLPKLYDFLFNAR